MVRSGYINVTADQDLINSLDEVRAVEGCKTRPEVIRLLLREYKKVKSPLLRILSENLQNIRLLTHRTY